MEAIRVILTMLFMMVIVSVAAFGLMFAESTMFLSVIISFILLFFLKKVPFRDDGLIGSDK